MRPCTCSSKCCYHSASHLFQKFQLYVIKAYPPQLSLLSIIGRSLLQSPTFILTGPAMYHKCRVQHKATDDAEDLCMVMTHLQRASPVVVRICRVWPYALHIYCRTQLGNVSSEMLRTSLTMCAYKSIQLNSSHLPVISNMPLHWKGGHWLDESEESLSTHRNSKRQDKDSIWSKIMTTKT